LNAAFFEHSLERSIQSETNLIAIPDEDARLFPLSSPRAGKRLVRRWKKALQLAPKGLSLTTNQPAPRR
jgi:hypothetical protein